MPLSKHLVARLLILVVLLDAGAALARRIGPGHAVELVVDGRSASIEIPVNPSLLTSIHFSSPVLDSIAPPMDDVNITVYPMSVLVKPRGHRAPSLLGNVLVTTRLYDVNVLLRLVPDPDDAVARVDVSWRGEMAAQAAPLEAHDQRMREFQEWFEKRDAARGAGAPGALARARLLADQDLLPVVDRTHSHAPGGVRVEMGPAAWIQDELWAAFEVENGNAGSLRLDDVHALGVDGTWARVTEIVLDAPDGGSVVEVPGGQRVRGVLRVPNAREPGMEPRALSFGSFDLPRPVVAAVEDWVLIPRRRSEVDADREAMGRISLHLLAMGGLALLDNPLAAGDRGAAGLTGLGMRLTYGLNRYLAFEAEVVGAGIGKARFEDVSWNGMQGDLEHSASLGRVQFGGLLRFGGGEYVPLVRFGVGGQGRSYDTQIVDASGNRMPGPKSSFELDMTVTLGVGLDVRLGKHFLAGVTVSVVSLKGLGEFQSVEAGVHLGYGWKPKNRTP